MSLFKRIMGFLLAAVIATQGLFTVPMQVQATTEGVEETTSATETVEETTVPAVQEISEIPYTYTIVDGEVTITGCDKSISGELVIPSVIEGCPVTAIGEEAFSYCADLTRVTIPEGVTSIENTTFSECASLTKITIPVSVTSIDRHAFSYCDNLKVVYYRGTEA